MYLFEAVYENVYTGEKITRNIEFDGDNLLDSEKDCYVHAMGKAYDLMTTNECLVSVDLISN